MSSANKTSSNNNFYASSSCHSPMNSVPLKTSLSSQAFRIPKNASDSSFFFSDSQGDDDDEDLDDDAPLYPLVETDGIYPMDGGKSSILLPSNFSSVSLSSAFSAPPSSYATGGAAGHSSLEDRKRKQQERNREIARQSRKRKRERLEFLEERVLVLEKQKRELENKLRASDPAENIEPQRIAALKEIQHLLYSKASDSELLSKLRTFKENFADFGTLKQRSIAHHLDNMKLLLTPNQVSQMILWCMHYEDDFYDEEKNQSIHGGGVWNILCEEIGLTEEQKMNMFKIREPVKEERENIRECQNTLKYLEELISKSSQALESQLNHIMNTITPSQQAKCLLWIENNQPFMKMLIEMEKAEAATMDNRLPLALPLNALDEKMMNSNIF